eukprot:754694-Hanusia_phi.AAC.8
MAASCLKLWLLSGESGEGGGGKERGSEGGSFTRMNGGGEGRTTLLLRRSCIEAPPFCLILELDPLPSQHGRRLSDELQGLG